MRSRCVSSPHTVTTDYGWVEGYPLNKNYPAPVPKPQDGKDYGWHTGTDYISDGKILAPSDSIVAGIGYNSTDGNYLILESANHRDWFSHIKTDGYLVHVNQQVKRGQHIAWQGRTGSASGVHVHHSLRKSGVMVDPELHINEEEEVKPDRQTVINYFKGFGVAGADGRVGVPTEAQIEYYTTRGYDVVLSDVLQDTWNRLVSVNRKVDELGKAVAILQKENESLKSQVGDTTALNMIKEGFKLLLGLK